MFTERFIVTTGVARDANGSSPLKKIPPPHNNIGIFLLEYQPLPSIKAIMKRTSTESHCVAANATHIFQAEPDKSLIHVWNIESAKREAALAFPEKVTSLALVSAARWQCAAMLAMGTESGKLMFWELHTGRQITAIVRHTMAVECLAVDPTSNWILTASPDTHINVWSIPGVVAYSSSTSEDPIEAEIAVPLHTLGNHSGPVTALVLGHSHYSANIAVSSSRDKSCMIWDYRTGQLLHTLLCKFIPTCLALDPADRALYIGQEYGFVQQFDFHWNKATGDIERKIVHTDKAAPGTTEPPEAERWSDSSMVGSTVSCIAVNYDGTAVIAGHECGRIAKRDAASGNLYDESRAIWDGPVSNILLLPMKEDSIRLDDKFGEAFVSTSSVAAGTSARWGQLTSGIQLPLFEGGYVPFSVARRAKDGAEGLAAELGWPTVSPSFRRPSGGEHGREEEAAGLRLRLREATEMTEVYRKRAIELEAELKKERA